MAFGRTRTIVCHIGPRSAALESACKHRNLKYLKTTIEGALKQCEGDARAIVVVASPVQLEKILRKSLQQALDNGVAFFAVDTDKARMGQVMRMFAREELARRLGIPPEDAKDDRLFRAIAFPVGPSWHQRVAQACADHDPGPSITGDCKVDNDDLDPDHAPDAQDLILLRRAFSDCQKIVIKYLPGGLSGARGPWLVDAQFRDGRRPVDWVVKTGKIKEITQEIDVMRDTCLNLIPFRHYPPVVEDRCVTSSTKRAIVSMFLENAVPLEQYILDNRADQVVARLFDGPLKLCRQGSNKGPVNIGQSFRERGVLPEAWVLKGVWTKVREIDPDVLSPEKLLESFVSHPAIEVMQVESHGDLHLRNIFVHEDADQKGCQDVLLIDFARWTQAPASYDPAILDAALAFDAPSGEAARVSDDQLLELYRPPLLEVGPMESANNRVAAIIALRGKIRGTVSEVEYQLAVVGWLLFHAKRGSVTAYRCASRILQSLSSGAL